MRRLMITAAVVALGLTLGLSGASAVSCPGTGVCLTDATPDLNPEFNIDGQLTGIGPGLSKSIDLSKFDATTGLGTITVNIGSAGAHFVGVALDHEIDEVINTFFNEFGATQGTPDAGLSWEIDEPGYTTGDIFANLEKSDATASRLDNTNSLPKLDDVALAQGWNFTVPNGDSAVVIFLVSRTPPQSGFYLSQTDPGSDTTIYLSSLLSGGIQAPPTAPGEVPEPGTLVLLGSGLFGLLAYTLRLRRSRQGI